MASRVAAFHTDTTAPSYHPRERFVYHDQAACEYGRRVQRDSNAIPGKGKDPQGNERELCRRCHELAWIRFP